MYSYLLNLLSKIQPYHQLFSGTTSLVSFLNINDSICFKDLENTDIILQFKAIQNKKVVYMLKKYNKNDMEEWKHYIEFESAYVQYLLEH